MHVEANRENVSRLFEKAQSYVKLRSDRHRVVDGGWHSAIHLVRESLLSRAAPDPGHVSVDQDALSRIHDLADRWDRSAMGLTVRLMLMHFVASYVAGIWFLSRGMPTLFLLAPLAVPVALPLCLFAFFWLMTGHRFDYYEGYTYWFAYVASRQYIFALLPAWGFMQCYRFSEFRFWPLVATALVVFVLPVIDYYFRF